MIDNNQQKRNDIFFIIFLVFLIFSIGLFNFIVDPYYIFRDSTIKGFNSVKTHKYTNRRTVIYSDMKINHKNKDIAFSGNCLLSHYGSGLDNVAFFTIPMAKVEEVTHLIKNIHYIAPNIKTIYWGLFFDDFWNDINEEVNDTLPEFTEKKINLKDIINLFFSYNTTKYSIETVRDSIELKYKGILYVYPYREIAKKTYKADFSFDNIQKVKEVIDFAKENNIELIIYYSPIHVSKKIHIYSKGKWELNQELKRKIADITPFYDYSLFNEYNSTPLDENNTNFIDNIHPTNSYNNLIVYDLLSKDKKLGTQIEKGNIESILASDTKNLVTFINNNKELYEKIKNVTEKDSFDKIKKNTSYDSIR